MAQGETKNLGQVAAILISAYAPENTRLIWYDTKEQIHKVYERSTGEWAALNPQIVTNSTLSSLKTIAMAGGLSIGKFYYLTDIGTLAIVITQTKVWYADSQGNYVVNDLVASIQSFLSSSNLTIDGTTGVWNNTTGKLEFTFTEATALNKDNDYVVIRRKSGSAFNWIKSKISSFISTVSGNSLSWNGGFYFNFNTAIANISNKIGGVVGYDAYTTNNRTISEALTTLGNADASVLASAKQYTDTQTSPANIFNKQHQQAFSPTVNPPLKPNTNATLNTILNILFGWVAKYQYADSMKMGSGFSSSGRSGNLNYADTVKNAIEKLLYKVNSQSQFNGITMNSDWDYNGRSGNISYGDTLAVVLEKLLYMVNHTYCDIRDYIEKGDALPKNKIYVYGVYPLECRSMRYGADELPMLVFGRYRGNREQEDSYPYPDMLYVFTMPDEEYDYHWSYTYDWNSAPALYKDLYRTLGKNVALDGISYSGKTGDVSNGDNLSDILEKLIYKVANLKADQMKLSTSFTSSNSSGLPLSNDTVQTAIAKLTKKISDIQSEKQVKLDKDIDTILLDNTNLKERIKVLEEKDKIQDQLENISGGVVESNKGISDKLDKTNNSLTDIDTRLKVLESEKRTVDNVEEVSDNVLNVKKDLDEVKEQVDTVSGSVDTLDGKTSSNTGSINNINQTLSDLSDRVSALEQDDKEEPIEEPTEPTE